jgi:DNA-binding CsgD family transcriptional regulator
MTERIQVEASRYSRKNRYSAAKNGGLTRHQHVMNLVAEGLTNQEIAERVGISVKQVTGCKAKENTKRGTGRRHHYVRGTLAERLDAKLDKNGPVHPRLGTRCWLWLGGTTSGGDYGAIEDTRAELGRKYESMQVHRVAWALANKQPLSPDFIVRHRCDVSMCCNPEHLEPGTHADNMRDKHERGRAYNPKLADMRCGNCHERGHRRTKCPKVRAA